MSQIDILINLAVVLAVIGLLAFLIYKGKTGIVKKIVLALVIQAEANWGSGTGKIKFAEVLGTVYAKLPMIVRIFITETALSILIEEAVDFMKEQLLDKKINENKEGK